MFVLDGRYDVGDDRHEAMIDTAEFAALSVVDAGTIDEEADLIKTARAGVHLNSKGRDGSAMQHVNGGNDHSSSCTSGKVKAIVNFKKAKSSF